MYVVAYRLDIKYFKLTYKILLEVNYVIYNVSLAYTHIGVSNGVGKNIATALHTWHRIDRKLREDEEEEEVKRNAVENPGGLPFFLFHLLLLYLLLSFLLLYFSVVLCYNIILYYQRRVRCACCLL